MAVEREVLKDITEYEAHLIGPLTIRQTVGLALAAITSVPTYLFLSQWCIKDFCIAIALVFAIPFLAIGFWKPYGVPLEKFAYKLLQLYILCPINRQYKTKNLYQSLEEDSFVPQKISSKEKKALTKEMQDLGYIAYK